MLRIESTEGEVMTMSIKHRLGALAAVAGLVVAGLVATTTPAPAAGGTRAAGTLAGTVYSHTGAGLGGATVTVYAPAGHLPAGGEPYGWKPVATAVSTAGGTFAVAGLTDTQAYRLKVRPAVLASDSYGYWVDDTHITPWLNLAGNLTTATTPQVHLTAPAAVSGTVTDLATGLPIKGVQVRAMSGAIVDDTNDDPTGPGTPSYGSDFLSTRTDRAGHYRLTGLPSQAPDPSQVVYGLVWVDPSGKHGGWMWWHGYYGGWQFTPTFVGAAGATVVRDVQLAPSGVLRVHLQDAAGRPVAGLQVQPTSAFPYAYAVTNAQGDIRIGGLSAFGSQGDAITVFASDPGAVADPTHSYRTTYYGQSPTAARAKYLLVPYGGTTKITMTVVRDAASVFGRAAPDSNVSVFATADTPLPGSDDLRWKLQAGGNQVLSDGWFMVTGLWPGADLTAYVTPPESEAFYWHVGALQQHESRDLGTISGP